MELINIIENTNSDINMYEDILNLYTNLYQNQEYIKNIKIEELNNTTLAKYSPNTKDIVINDKINKIISTKILEQGIRSKYNLSVDKLTKIMKSMYIIHEIRHAYQKMIYDNNYKNIYTLNSDNIYTKIIGDCIHYQTPSLYLAYYPYIVIEKDSEITSNKEIIKNLLNTSDENYNKILKYYTDTFLNKIIKIGYINNDLARPSIQMMYTEMNILEEYLLLSDAISNLDTIDKITYNARLSLDEHNMLENMNNEEKIKKLIRI